MNPLRGSTPPTRHGAQVPADLDGQLTHDGVAGERQIYAICARRSWLPRVRRSGDDAGQRKSCTLLEDGLISIFARCLLTALIL
jgi:hypothetical protein